MLIALHCGVAARSIQHFVPFFFSQLAISVLVSFIKHFSNLNNTREYLMAQKFVQNCHFYENVNI